MYFSFYLTNDAYNYIMNFFQYIDSKKEFSRVFIHHVRYQYRTFYNCFVLIQDPLSASYLNTRFINEFYTISAQKYEIKFL